jgi:hypothetical protein
MILKANVQIYLLFINTVMLEDPMENEIEILVSNKRLLFSITKMTWDEGEVYCQKKSGHIASISDSKILSAVLEKMSELGMNLHMDLLLNENLFTGEK